MKRKRVQKHLHKENRISDSLDVMPTRAELKEASAKMLKALQQFEHPPANAIEKPQRMMIYPRPDYVSGCGSPAAAAADA